MKLKFHQKNSEIRGEPIHGFLVKMAKYQKMLRENLLPQSTTVTENPNSVTEVEAEQNENQKKRKRSEDDSIEEDKNN